MKNYSMRSKKRRNHQRWLNGYVRKINNIIANDSLWRGRFVVEQKATEMEWFDDKSGGILHCYLQFRDKATGITKDWYTNCVEVDWKIGFELNSFIVSYCKVWQNENLNPREDTTDYRSIR